MRRFLPWVVGFVLSATPLSGGVIINELLTGNTSETGLQDEDGQRQDWIELYNTGPAAVDLGNFALTDDPDRPDQWRFPTITLAPGQFLIIFASGKDRPPGGGRLHTNFRLAGNGEYLGLFNLANPGQAVSELAPQFPEQRDNYSFGRNSGGAWVYFARPTPGGANGDSPLAELLEPVHFSVNSGIFDHSFTLVLAAGTPGSMIRYTTDGSAPTEGTGSTYLGPITVFQSQVIRAAAFKANALPSSTTTRSYLFNVTPAQRSLPILAVTISPSDLIGRFGIQGIGGGYYERIDCCFSNWVRVRAGDYFNPAESGIAWERPVTLELLEAATGEPQFRVNSGIRVHGSESSRLHYQPDSKFSYNLFFRGDYGDARLDFPLMPESRVKSFDSLVARAGHNDSINPFLTDELMRRLYADMGQVSSLGTFVNLFVDGVYKGYYNLVERINADWAQEWHGGGKDWDVIQPYTNAQNGDKEDFENLLSFVDASNLMLTANYQEVERRLDLVNFVDYVLLNIYGDTRDWTQNNWRAARERVPNSKWRFYVWDAEIALGIFGTPASHNLIKDPEELGHTGADDLTQIPRLFRKLKTNAEFRLLFADRVQKHFAPGGALSAEKIVARFQQLRGVLAGVIPDMLDYIPKTWVPQRKDYVLQHLSSAGLLAGIQAPTINHQGGRVAHGFAVTLSAATGPIYYTLDGTDPRVPLTGAVSPKALTYSGPISLGQSADLKARAFSGGTWSALTEANFSVSEFGFPIRITELMYHPKGGEAYEFVELKNFGGAPVDLSDMFLDGVNFIFPRGSLVDPGSTIVLASDSNPQAFAARYPQVPVYGYFPGNLANSSERISLRNIEGQSLTGVTYRDDEGWPTSADGAGYSLEMQNPQGDPDDPANWAASAAINGSPGTVNDDGQNPVVRLNEVMAENVSAVPTAVPGRFSDWIELYNSTASAIELTGWSLTDDENVQKFMFPPGTTIAPRSYLLVWCDLEFTQPGLHTGFALDREGETIALYDSFKNRIDAVAFGMQLPNTSIGVINSQSWQLCQPTPGVANSAAPLGSIYELKINEWLANPFTGAEDWIELYNGDLNRPVALQGLHLLTSNGYSQLGSLAFLGPGQQIRLWADNGTGPQHLDFKLPAQSGFITLYSGSGNTIDEVVYGAQAEGVSQGLAPDGSEQIVSFTSPSPGYNNVPLTSAGVQLNEVLVRNRSGGTGLGWVELSNPTAAPVDLSGMRLTIDRQKPNQWAFPNGSVLPASGFLVVSFDNSLAASTANTGQRMNTGHSLSANGGGVYLFNRSGQLVDQVEFGFQVADRSIGRLGRDWQLLAAVTPGAANSGAAPLGSPQQIRINEWLAVSDQADEWLELYNLDAAPVNLTGLCLSDDPSLAGRMKFKFGPLSFIEARGFVCTVADGDPSKGPHHLNFSLDQAGETLQVCNASGALIDSIWFGPQSPGVSQGRDTDGRGNTRSFSVPTPGDPNSPDTDGDGIPDRWESIFAMNPNNPADAALDSDRDGADNLEEYRAGTHPGDPRMCLKFHETVHQESDVRLRFIAAPNRSYSVVYRASPAVGEWTKLKDIPAEPEGRWVGVSDNGGPGNPIRFYGLVSPQLP